MSRRWLASLLAALAAAAGCGDESATRPGGVPGGDRAAAERGEPNEALPAEGWAAPNGDQENRRNVRGPIDRETVAGLRPVWRLPMESGFAATPVVVDGVVYLQDLASNVTAVSLRDGSVRWQAVVEDPNVGPNGVNVADGRVFGATNADAFALDADSGEVLWTKTLIRNPAEAIDMAPGYKNGTVYVSPAVRRAGAAGVLWALDAETGATKWKWAQQPLGLWGRPDVNAGGGLWHPPGFDDEGGVYLGIANPLPFPGTEEDPWGTSRPGPNKWNNSLVKLDARTGRFLWGRQVVPHDIYDWDLQCPPILTRANGRDVVLAAGKMGFVYAFDADSGRPLWKRSVGLHNGHDDDNLLALRGELDRLRTGVKLLPGNWGGVQTQMASDGPTVYVPVNNLWVVYTAQDRWRQQDVMEGTGEVVAIDVASGRVKWQRKLPHGVYGAATVSNDVVFTTTYEGTVWALDARNGEVLWRASLPGGSISPVAVAGDTLLAVGAVALDERQRPALVAFRLGQDADGGR